MGMNAVKYHSGIINIPHTLLFVIDDYPLCSNSFSYEIEVHFTEVITEEHKK